MSNSCDNNNNNDSSNVYNFNIQGNIISIKKELISKSIFLENLVKNQIFNIKKDNEGNFILEEDIEVFIYVKYLLETNDIDDVIYDKYKDQINEYNILENMYSEEFTKIKYYEKVCRHLDENSKVKQIEIFNGYEIAKELKNNKIEIDFCNKDLLFNNSQYTNYSHYNSKIQQCEILENFKKIFIEKVKIVPTNKYRQSTNNYIMNKQLLNDFDYKFICIAGGSIINTILGIDINDIDIFLTIPNTYSKEIRKKNSR
jgi:hypothetical protein